MDVRVPRSNEISNARLGLEEDVCVRACMSVNGGKPASVPRHPSDHCLHKGFLG